VLQHLEAPAEAIAELRRVTRPGGCVGMSDPDWRTALLDTPTGYSERFLSLDYAAPRTPTMGRQLQRLARAAGLVEVDIETWTLLSTEFAFLNQAGELAAWTDAMQAAGDVTAAAVDDWFEGLRRADEAGELFGSITGFTVVGTVPEHDD
jgi:ubiquinone/menaquinone biosynthesis C-methylase UbiE